MRLTFCQHFNLENTQEIANKGETKMLNRRVKLKILFGMIGAILIFAAPLPATAGGKYKVAGTKISVHNPTLAAKLSKHVRSISRRLTPTIFGPPSIQSSRKAVEKMQEFITDFFYPGNGRFFKPEGYSRNERRLANRDMNSALLILRQQHKKVLRVRKKHKKAGIKVPKGSFYDPYASVAVAGGGGED